MQTILWPILRRAFRRPLAPAIVDDHRTWRYLDLVGGAFILADRIDQTTDRPRVGILLPTSGAFPMAAMACWMLGRVPVPVNFLLSPAEQQHIIEHSEVDTLITARAMLEALDEPPKNVKRIALEDVNFRKVPPLRLPHIASATDTAVILYTSGTSGRPKGVQLTHRNLIANVRACVKHINLTHADGFLGALPQFHSFGLTALTLLPLVVGCKTVFSARFVPKKIVDLIRKHRPDIFIAIPSMYNALLSIKSAGPEDFKSVKLPVSGGEALPRDVRERFQERFGLRILEGYGLTETAPVVSWNLPPDGKDGSVGKLLPGVRARIVDDDGRDLPVGEEGEILIDGPNVMAGYLKQPDATAETFDRQNYFITGDWGKLDEDGYLYITGRKKEMLIIGGENVFPREIEEVLNRHPSVHESAVIGKPDPSRGEVAVAFVELEEGAEFDESALRAFCRESLAGFKVPRQVRPVVALPRNPTGKILRRELIPRLDD